MSLTHAGNIDKLLVLNYRPPEDYKKRWVDINPSWETWQQNIYARNATKILPPSILAIKRTLCFAWNTDIDTSNYAGEQIHRCRHQL